MIRSPKSHSPKVSGLRRFRRVRNHHAPLDGAEDGRVHDDNNDDNECAFDVSDSDSTDDPIIPRVMNNPSGTLLVDTNHHDDDDVNSKVSLECDGLECDGGWSSSSSRNKKGDESQFLYKIDQQGLIQDHMAFKSKRPDPTDIDGNSEHGLSGSTKESLLLGGTHDHPNSLLTSLRQISTEPFHRDQIKMESELLTSIKSSSPGQHKESTSGPTPRLFTPPGVQKATYDHDIHHHHHHDDKDDDNNNNDIFERDGSNSRNNNFEEQSMDPELSKLSGEEQDDRTHGTRINQGMDTTYRSGPPPGAFQTGCTFPESFSAKHTPEQDITENS